MARYKVLSPQFTLGAVGEVVELDESSGLNLRALVKSRALVVVPPPKRKKASDDVVAEESN